jgi:DNA-binding response OmpR family regulator
MKVLVAEDELNIRNGLREILEEEGYQVVEAAAGDQVLAVFRRERPDFVCLDIMMPGKSGYDVCRDLRQLDAEVPIVFISAKSQEIDKVLGLELGADDYILKPFGVREVVARIRAITRRCLKRSSRSKAPESFRMRDLEIFPKELRARRADLTIELGLRELKILTLLQREAGKAVSRDQLFNECWGCNYLPNSRTLEQTISNLRKKIELDPQEPQIIQTVHAVGYRFEE